MKRFILLIMIYLPITAMAQDRAFSQMVEKYSSKQNCTTIELTKDALNMETNISNMWAISVETAELIEEFSSDVEQVISSKYTPMLSVNHDGESVKIYSIQKDGKICDIVVCSIAHSEGVIVRIVGDDITLSQAASLISTQ